MLIGAKGAYTVEYAVCICIYSCNTLYINIFIDMSGFTVQSMMIYKVNLLTIPGMQCFYALE